MAYGCSQSDEYAAQVSTQHEEEGWPVHAAEAEVPSMKHRVHIHQHRLRQGLAAVIHRTYKGSEYHRVFEIPKGAKVIQSDTPLSCGARAWIEWDE